MSKQDVYDFTEEIQNGIIKMMFFDHESFASVKELIKPEYFESTVLADLARIMINFHDKYGRCIEIDELLQEVRDLISASPRPLSQEVYYGWIDSVLADSSEIDYHYIRDKIVNWSRDQLFKLSILEGARLYGRHNRRTDEDFTRIHAAIDKAYTLGNIVRRSGYFYFRETEQRLSDRKAGWVRSELAIPTGVPPLDHRLGGGIAPGELGILMGPMKRGKSITLVNFAEGALRQGKNVLYAAFETTDVRGIAALFDAHFSGVPTNQLKSSEEEIRKHLNNFLSTLRCGELDIERFLAHKDSVASIESLLIRVKQREGLNFNLLLLDYLGLIGTQIKFTDLYSRYGQLTKELLALAREYNLAIWLIHQSNRGTITKESVIGMEDSGDSIEPMRDADIILTLNQTEAEAAPEGDVFQDCRIFCAGARAVSDKWCVPLKINKARVLLVEPGMED